MTMRTIFWVALLFIAAVALSLAGRFDQGHVLLIWPPYRVDLSLNLCVAIVIIGFLLIYGLMRAASSLWRMPSRLAAYRSRARADRARAALRDALANLFAGRFARAEKAARNAGTLAENRQAAGLIGASAAHGMREYARRDEWLNSIDARDWQDARTLAAAELRLDADDAEGALATLEQLPTQAARRIQAQRVALKAHQRLQHWQEVLRLVKILEKRDAIATSQANRLVLSAAQNLLRERRYNADALIDCWNSLPAPQRYDSRTADLAAELLLALERPADARRIVEEALSRQWDGRLVRRYAECADGAPLGLIQRAETWQAEHPDDPDLMFALGRLCVEQRLWGKAQAFLEDALARADEDVLKVRVHRTLARLHESLGRGDEAAQHYRASATAIKLA
ncbi:MAG: heme biosynthesis HemY N-terminal domain-containing protein [Janthinobacterium lividum]